MIRIFHPDHGYLLVNSEQEKNRLLESGGQIAERIIKHEKQITKQAEQDANEEEVLEDIVIRGPISLEEATDAPRRGRPPKKWP